MPERREEMRERQPRSGRSDEFVMPEINRELLPGVMEAGNAGGGGDWENRFKAAEILKEPEAYEMALEAAEAAMRDALDLGDVVEYKRVKAARDKINVRLSRPVAGGAIVPEIQRQFDNLLNPMTYGNDMKARQDAARRWLGRFPPGTQGVSPDMINEVEKILREVPGKALEIDPNPETKIEIRMAMIKDLGVSASGDPNQRCEQFIRQQVSKLGGIGKTHFSAEYERELRREYTARAELAGVVSFWDDLGSIMSKSTDVWKEMTEARIDRCIKLSKTTYEWLADGKKKTSYKVEEGVERSGEKEVDLRKQMDKVAATLYARMVKSDLDIWNTRGEDRWSRIGQIAEELKVSTDAVRLTWQLAEAECWQARMGVSFISHPAAKVVLASKFRDFRTRKVPDAPVPGGSRLWSEWLRAHNNQYPAGDSTYDPEGRRLARVGFEAWVIRVTKEKDIKGNAIDPRFGKYRDGLVYLFSDNGVAPRSLQSALEDDLLTIDRAKGQVLKVRRDQLTPNLGELLRSVIDADDIQKYTDAAENTIGGERALLSGQYFAQLEMLLKQPGFLDVDLPQTVTMTDISKAAGVFDAIESFGKIDATKATTDELAKLKSALTSQYFRFQSNDLDKRGGTKKRRIVIMEGTPQERTVDWVIGSGVQERMSKARIQTGQLMEQWSRSYVWLLSWANAANAENRVVGMHDWILLSRDVVRGWDELRQWGQFVGYGYGNYDKNELAVDEIGQSRKGATLESKQAAKAYVKWYEKMFEVNQAIVVGKKRQMTDARRQKDMNELGTFSPGFIFWRQIWW